MSTSSETADALYATLISPNVEDLNGEDANIVDAVAMVARMGRVIARAICADAVPGHDAADGHVECLTAAVMGITAGLVRVAEAISELADAVREHK